MVLRERLLGIARFGEAKPVSPTIRFFRYSLLTLGILYGYTRNNFLQARADKYKDIRSKKKAERLEREAAQKKHDEEVGLKYIEDNIGVKI